MARRDKLVRRFRGRPGDFTWQELVRLFEDPGYSEARPGKSGGSRRHFIHPDPPAISLHEPHPGRIVKKYVIDDILRLLTDEELI